MRVRYRCRLVGRDINSSLDVKEGSFDTLRAGANFFVEDIGMNDNPLPTLPWADLGGMWQGLAVVILIIGIREREFRVSFGT